jgi:hypothetical protein
MEADVDQARGLQHRVAQRVADQGTAMSHATLVELGSALCPWLVLVWCLQHVATRLLTSVRGWELLALAGTIAAAIMLVPVQGLALARWIAGLNANFSISLTGLLAVIVSERLFRRALFSEREWTTAWLFGATGALVLYPMGLGLGSVDPYEWGWRFSPLFVVMGVLTTWILWNHNRFGFVLLLAVVAYQLRLLESTNYWDYLLDPVYSLVSLSWVVRRLSDSTRSSLTKRYSKALPRNISTI